MKYRNTIIALGFIILISSTSFIGVPRSWKEFAIVLAALAIVVLSYLAGKEKKVSVPTEVEVDGQ